MASVLRAQRLLFRRERNRSWLHRRLTSPHELSWLFMESLDDGEDGGGSSANSRSLSRPLFELVMYRGDRMEASSDPSPCR